MKSVFTLALLAASGLPVHADQPVGVAYLDGMTAQGKPMTLSVWYPTEGGDAQEIGGNAVFNGAMAVLDAPIAKGSFPVAMVLHGGLRSADNSGAWLSAKLARSGYVAVEVNGPRPESAADAVNEIWRRPGYFSDALDVVLGTDSLAGRIDQSKIAAVGFALGGTAALAAGGAGFDVQRYIEFCDSADAGGPDCAWYSAQGVSLNDVDHGQLAISRRDPRFSAAVAINPEYSEVVAKGMASVDIPILVVSLGGNGSSAKDPGGAAASGITITAGNIFDGFPVCTKAGPSILSEDGGDAEICGESAEAREHIHDQTAKAITSFLATGSAETE